MSTAQRVLFVLFVLAAAGGVGFLLLEMREDPQPAGLDLGGPPAAVAPPRATSTGPSGPTGPVVRSAARPDEPDSDGTSLEVLVVDDRGRPLPAATVELLGDEGARVEGQGSFEWADATPGTWALTVSSEGMLPYRREVVVEAGVRARVTAQLRDHVHLEGRTLDLLGRPVTEKQIWLLAEGQAHPAKGENVKEWPGSMSDRVGEFTLRAPAEGTWRISVGLPGEELLRSGPLDLYLGGPEELEAVLATGGTLRIEMSDLSPALREGRAVLRVAVLKRRKNTAPDVTAEEEGRRRREGGRRAREEGEELSTEDRNEAAGTPASDLDAWKEVALFPLDREGRAEFGDLPVGPDLRLAFLRKNDRFESENSFVLLEGQLSVARFSMPPKRIPEEIAAQPVGSFYSAVLVQPGDSSPGIRFVD